MQGLRERTGSATPEPRVGGQGPDPCSRVLSWTRGLEQAGTRERPEGEGRVEFGPEPLGSGGVGSSPGSAPEGTPGGREKPASF